MRFLLLFLLLAASLHGAITERYVSSSGSGSGTAIGTPMSYAAFITAITTSGTASAGLRFNIKADGVYNRTGSDSWQASGTSTLPLIIRGYKTTPGDGYLGRVNGNGALDVTNMPALTYTTSSGRILGSAASWIIYESLNISSENTFNTINLNTSNLVFAYNCKFSNNNVATSSSAYSSGGTALNCDFVLTATSGGGSAASVAGVLDSCRVQSMSAAAPALILSGTPTILFSTIWGGLNGIKVPTGTSPYIRGNTIVGCAGDGILFETSTTTIQRVIGNMITDNTGDGIEMTGVALSGVLAFNRLRDNANSINNGGDWITATSYEQALLNTGTTGDTSTDYVNYATQDFNLVRTSPATSASTPKYMSVGALQRDQTQATGGGPVQRSHASVK